MYQRTAVDHENDSKLRGEASEHYKDTFLARGQQNTNLKKKDQGRYIQQRKIRMQRNVLHDKE